MYGLTDGFTPVSYRTSALWGRCPKSNESSMDLTGSAELVAWSLEVIGRCPEHSGKRFREFRPERADFSYERADFRLGKANLRSVRADFRPERVDLRPERNDVKLQRLDSRPQ